MLDWIYDAASGKHAPNSEGSPLIESALSGRVAKTITDRFESATELAAHYDNKYGDTDEAISHLVRNQKRWIASSSFTMNLPGHIIALVAIPINIVSVIYFQVRLVQAIAILRGYDLTDDKVKTFVKLSLLGAKAGAILKEAGVHVSMKVGHNLLKSLSGEVLKSINRAVGFRFATKFGTTGVVNLAAWLPVVGGVVSGTIDYNTTEAIAQFAMKEFPEIEPVEGEAPFIDGSFEQMGKAI